MLHLRLNELQPALQQLSAATANEDPSELAAYRLAFLTMTHARLGQMEDARGALEQLKQLVSDNGFQDNQDVKNVISEAEAAVKE
jgi:hypothetical protein